LEASEDLLTVFTPVIQIRDLATPRLKAMVQALSPTQRQALMQRLGKELEKQLKAHFLKREGEGNKQGFPPQHFWAREVRDKTALREATADRAVVGIDSAKFRFKVNGGTIRPGPGRRLLAIPLRAEAYGVLPRAGTIPGLFFKKMAGGKMYLAAKDGSALRVYWRLVPSVTQPPDPRALPPMEQLSAALELKTGQEVGRILNQGK
jgi:hypothetical protein